MSSPAEDVKEVFSRLFDHRPFLQGEIQNFKKEFEDKRQDREVERFFKALEHTTEIKQVRFDRVIEASDENLPRTIADIQVALRMCEDTLSVENNFCSDELLASKRAERQLRLANAELLTQEKLKNLEDSYVQKKEQLENQFRQLEKSIVDNK